MIRVCMFGGTLALVSMFSSPALAQAASSEDFVPAPDAKPSDGQERDRDMLWHLPPPQQAYRPPMPPEECVDKKLRSVPLIITGVILMSVSPVPFIGGAATGDGGAIGALFPVGGVMLITGIVLTAVGAANVAVTPQSAPEPRKPKPISLGLGAGGLGLQF